MSENLSSNTQTCPVVGYQKASVCVPVTVTPFAHPGDIKTFCCGEPKIKAGTDLCEGEVSGSCTFTITQDICVAVPVEFGAISKVGDAAVKCGEPSSKDICEHCYAESEVSANAFSF